MTAPSITTMVDAADVSVTMDQRLDAIRALAECFGGRPIPYPRWKAHKLRITAELERRAAAEGKSEDEILTGETESAIALVAPSALAAGSQAFAAAYKRELRAGAANELLEALIGDSRHDFEALGDKRHDLDVDPAETAHAERLIERLPEIAGLTEREAGALLDSLSNGDLKPADRMAVSRGRKKIRAALPTGNNFSQ